MNLGRFNVASADLLPSPVKKKPFSPSENGTTTMSIFDETDIDRPLKRTSFFSNKSGSKDEADKTGLTLYEEDKRTLKIAMYDDEVDHDKANLGTFFGVFLPCCQNIVGVIFFVRFPWIVGAAGWIQGLVIVGLCCLVSFTVAISISAIATNGKVTGGGTYFMISRSLGPAFGGSVGILFFMGTSISVAMYYIGTIETLLNYIAPEMSIFGGDEFSSGRFNDYRVYGTILLLLMASIVFVGVTCVQRFGLFAIIFLVAAISSVLVGLAVADENSDLKVCKLGDRVLHYSKVHFNGTWYCNKDEDGPIHQAFCKSGSCEKVYLDNEPKLITAIPGFNLRILKDNMFNKYANKKEIASSNIQGDGSAITELDIVTDISTSFVILMAIYFPSITGVESGSNYSGDLRNPHRSIPFGTMAAVTVTSLLYMSCVVFFAGSVEPPVLVDKYGRSVSESGEMMLSLLAWPSKWVVLVGTLTATTGAGLQALAGGPRLLLAIATDGIFPFLKFFSKTWKGEPTRCLSVTFLISLSGILISQLDMVAPIVTMFFLMCYGFINFAVTLQSLLDLPHWRPSFKFYHWIMTLFGTSLCITIMFMSSWIYATVALLIAFCLYQYIEFKGAEKDWGDGMTGLSMSAAIYAMGRLKTDVYHTKNWRPQLLVLLKPFEDEASDFNEDNMSLIQLSMLLQMGKGLTLYASVIQGSLAEHAEDMKIYKQLFRKKLDKVGAKGFTQLAISENVSDALSCMLQCAGLGPLRPNTVILGWPWEWSLVKNVLSHRIFIELMRNVALCNNALIVMKVKNFPNGSERLQGTIDIWWIVNDGGMLLLLSHLIKRTKTFGRCVVRVFSVAESKDNTVQIERDIKKYLYELRMDCVVEVVEMTTDEISAYVYERTIKLEERNKMLSLLCNNKRKASMQGKEMQAVLEKARSFVECSKQATLTDGAEKKLPRFWNRLLAGVKPCGIEETQDIPEKNDINAENVRHMNTAMHLNELLIEKSGKAKLIILNLPCPPQKPSAQANYMSFLDVLTEGLDNLLLVRGTGGEVITIFN